MSMTLETGKTIQGVASAASVITCTISGMEYNTTTGLSGIKQLAQLQVPSSAGVLYTVPASNSAIIKEVVLQNTSGTQRTVTMYAGGTAGANATMNLTIPANGTAIYGDGGWVVYGADGIALNTIGGAAGGDLSGAYPNPTVKGINGVTLSGLGTGLLKNTTGTGVPSIAVAGTDYLSPAAIGTTVQAFDTDLNIIAGLSPSNNDFMQYKSGAWSNRNPTQVTADLNLATSSLQGLMSAAIFNFLAALNGPTIILATSNAYSNITANGSTDDTSALNTLLTNAPDGSTIVFPGQNSTVVLSSAASIPSGRHYVMIGGGPGGKTHILQTSLTADHFTCNDWYSTFSGFDFVCNNTSATGVQALTNGQVLNINTINTALVPATGTIQIGSAIGWQTLTYSARTASTITLSQAGTGNSIAGAPIVFKTAGAAINAGNLVGIDAFNNSFSYCYNGYVCAGSTANQSIVSENGFLNTINFDIWIDGANWNGIIDSNTADCTVNSRSVSHCEITQCGSVTGQGNQFIRGQFNMRLGSTTAAYPAGVFGVYFTNTFFDNAGTDAIKFQGISAIQRVKITSSWISSAAAMGVNFASTASTLPTDIEFTSCNVYGNGSNGYGGAGVADYKVLGGQVAANVTGFSISPATGGVYSAFIQGVRVGPTGGFGANTTGFNIAAGTYTQIIIDNCDSRGNTTALTLGAVTVTNWDRFRISNNPGINPRGTVTPPAASPVTATTYTNQTGFPVHVTAKGATITALTINGVASFGMLANQAIGVTLQPGATFLISGTTLVWAWSGM